MPFIPRRYPSAASFPSELRTPPKAHAPIPVAERPKAGEARKGARRIGPDSLSLRDYEPDPKELIKTMFGKEAEIDSHTGQLVPTVPTHHAAAVRPGG